MTSRINDKRPVSSIIRQFTQNTVKVCFTLKQWHTILPGKWFSGKRLSGKVTFRGNVRKPIVICYVILTCLSSSSTASTCFTRRLLLQLISQVKVRTSFRWNVTIHNRLYLDNSRLFTTGHIKADLMVHLRNTKTNYGWSGCHPIVFLDFSQPCTKLSEIYHNYYCDLFKWMLSMKIINNNCEAEKGIGTKRLFDAWFWLW